MSLLLLVICIIAAVSLYFYHFPLIEVVGDSMCPTFQNGEFLKARRVSSNERLVEGKVYVYKTPTGEVVIKRLDHINSNNGGLFFIGDNIRCSFDSRSYGYIPRENVIAEIINP